MKRWVLILLIIAFVFSFTKFLFAETVISTIEGNLYTGIPKFGKFVVPEGKKAVCFRIWELIISKPPYSIDDWFPNFSILKETPQGTRRAYYYHWEPKNCIMGNTGPHTFWDFRNLQVPRDIYFLTLSAGTYILNIDGTINSRIKMTYELEDMK